MAESCEEWAVKGKKNVWGFTPSISQLQSEGGVAGAVHGALQTGTLMTTFTASQGLLLMIPNMYKISGELTSFVMHVSARALASHGLSIFGDQTDVMACRQTGFAMICSNSAQEAHDMALVCHAATLLSRVPFMHFFDGFRTSHEINTYDMISDDIVKEMLPYEKILEIRERSLNPEKPFIRGTAQNPDVYFQSWEARNPYYAKCAEIVAEQMEKLGKLTGRTYKPYEYVGAPDAEEIVVMMGSGAETTEEVAKVLNASGKKVGVLKIRMFRPFSVEMFAKAIPQSVKKITVLDRTKELGAMGEPLYEEVSASVAEARNSGILPRSFDPIIIGGRYALGSKDYTPAMAKGVFDNMASDKPKNHFSVGIIDDVTNASISYDESFKLEDKSVLSAVFFGLGSDGTVGANKNTIKIIGHETPNYAQAYFVYDSKKSGGITVSHLRFGPNPIKAPYLVNNAQFVGCHQFSFMEKYNVLGCADKGAVFLLNSIYDAKNVWNHLNKTVQQTIIDTLDQGVKVHVLGRGANHTDITVALHELKDPAKETIFENCVADCNIPVGEVFTSPKLEGTNGVLEVTETFLAGLYYKDLRVVFRDGMVTEYHCSNFDSEEKNLEYLKETIMNRHESLPIGEFAIGTNTTAYAVSEKYGIGDQLPVLIAEKMGPHFAVGDTCYSWGEDCPLYNPDGKEIIARDNEVSILRKEDVSKAYFGCHTDITVPYKELGAVRVIKADGSEISIIENGRFVLPGTEELNEPLDE